ncbi:gamma-glutamyltransferase, partial [Burkholderia pseudomallei]
TMQQAIALPNFGSRNGPSELELGRVSDALAGALMARGHDVRVVELGSSLKRIQRIYVELLSVWFGGSDPLRDGFVAGD